MCGGGESVGVLLHSYPTASASRVLDCRCVSPCQAKFSINIKKIKYIHSDPGTRFKPSLAHCFPHRDCSSIVTSH